MTLAMIDNGLVTLTPADAATNEMSSFQSSTWTDGLRFAAPDTTGLLLFQQASVKDDRAPGSIDYMSEQFTRCAYLIKVNVDVFWADINGNTTADPSSSRLHLVSAALIRVCSAQPRPDRTLALSGTARSYRSECSPA